MIKHYTLKLLEKALNKALNLDPHFQVKCKALEGKVLHVVIAPLGVGFYIQFSAGSVHLLANYDRAPDTTITSNPLGLIRLSVLPASKVRSLFNDKVHIAGDIEVGQKVKQIFDEIDIDWEGFLAQFTGDVVAYQLGSWVRKGRTMTAHMKQSLKTNMADYVQEELRVLPTREEMEDFYHDVRELFSDVERLEAHLMDWMADDKTH